MSFVYVYVKCVLGWKWVFCDSESVAHRLRLLALGSARAKAQQTRTEVATHARLRSKATGHNTSTDPSTEVGPTGLRASVIGLRGVVVAFSTEQNLFFQAFADPSDTGVDGRLRPIPDPL